MTHPTPEAVAAMIAELREWADNFPVSEPTFASAADLLAALSAERDALTERCGRAERERDEHATDDFDARQYLMDAVTKAESDLAAARETIAAKDAEIAKLREAAKSGLRFVGASDDALLEANATIARLTRERDESVKAEREACAKVYDEFFDWVSKQISRATYLAEAHKKGKAAWATLANSMFDGTLASYRDAIRARTNTKEPTT